MTLYDAIYDIFLWWNIVVLGTCLTGIAVISAMRLVGKYKRRFRATVLRHIKRRRDEKAIKFANRPNGYHNYKIRTR